MNREHLNEHDAQQGAESKGEFLGMTGNSAWYLLGSSGAGLLIVVVMWGMLGLSLLLCLFVGFVLCGLSVAYVFALKNNRPEHYDTDFFEMALVEAGMIPVAFGPRAKRPPNPFRADPSIEKRHDADEIEQRTAKAQQRRPSATIRGGRPVTKTNSATLVQYIIRVWDRSREDLGAKLTALKAAVGNMERAVAYEPALETSARNFFYSSWPGWSFSGYDALWQHYDDALVANILPFSSTPVGYLDDAEFIFEGANGNLVGGRTFVGEGNSLTPQNAVVLGTVGSGKTVLTISILSQTECYRAFTMIVEEVGIALVSSCCLRRSDAKAPRS